MGSLLGLMMPPPRPGSQSAPAACLLATMLPKNIEQQQQQQQHGSACVFSSAPFCQSRDKTDSTDGCDGARVRINHRKTAEGVALWHCGGHAVPHAVASMLASCRAAMWRPDAVCCHCCWLPAPKLWEECRMPCCAWPGLPWPGLAVCRHLESARTRWFVLVFVTMCVCVSLPLFVCVCVCLC